MRQAAEALQGVVRHLSAAWMQYRHATIGGRVAPPAGWHRPRSPERKAKSPSFRVSPVPQDPSHRPVGRHGATGPLLLASLVAVLAASGLSAGGPEVPGDAAARLSEVTHVRLVLLPTSVSTRRGKPVPGLATGDFRLLDDGVPQEIRLLATEKDTPIALAFLLDVSGSMELSDRLDRAKVAIRIFVESLTPRDRFGLIGFADRKVSWITPFTSDRAAFLERLDVQEAEGKTALYDALAASPQIVDDEIEGRKAIVLITDGLDNASDLQMLPAVWLARRVNVPIYTLSFIPMHEKLLPRRARDAERILKRFAGETGGSHFPVYGPKDLPRAVEAIQAELRFQYVLGYYPTHDNWDGTFRPVRLETLRESLTVRTRRGYYATP